MITLQYLQTLQNGQHTHRAARRVAILLLVGLLICGTAVAQSSSSTAERIDEVLEKYHDLRQFNGAVLVAKDGEVIYQKGFGEADMEWDIANTPDTKFRIGSVTKQFTAVLILKLAEEGKIDLQETVRDYFPDYPAPQGDQVTIHHLLTHTSGIPSYTNFPEYASEIEREPFAPDSLVKLFSGRDLEFEPGTEWRYSNSGYFLLGAIIEEITGKPYHQVLQERILDPLALRNTGYDHYGELIDRRANGYVRTFEGYENARYFNSSVPYAAGSMYSTVRDLYKWDQALYTDRLFEDPKYKEMMFTPHMQDYGYGWFIREMPLGEDGDEVKVIEHGGGIRGFITGFMRLVDDRHLVVVMDNTQSNTVQTITEDLARLVYGQAVELPKASVAKRLYETVKERGAEAAVQQYRTLKEQRPDAYNYSASALNNLGIYYVQNGQHEAALTLLQLNAQEHPDVPAAHSTLAAVYQQLGNAEQAQEHRRRASELSESE